jgi:hypothetical protein
VEASQLVQGYYEQITEASLQSHAFFDGGRASPGQHLAYQAMTRPRNDMLELELIPNFNGEIGGARLTINRWGMRDRDVEKQKPAGIYRVAVVGSSVVMGYGVRDDEVFETLLEDRLNAKVGGGQPRVEFLNFGVGRYYAIHRRLLIEKKVLEFQPDAIYYVAHQDELLGPPRHLATAMFQGHRLPVPCFEEVLREAGIREHTSWGMKQLLLTQNAESIVLCVYRDLVADCRRRNILPVWIYLPIPGIADAPPHSGYMLAMAAQGGFVTLDLSDWADDAPAEVKLNPLDHHVNALGHRIIAERLFEAIQQRSELLPATPRENAP